MQMQNIPIYLKEHARFCCRRYEKNARGRKTELPYNPVTGSRASVKSLASFSSFSEAETVLRYYDGIGIRVSGSILVMDIDRCIGKDGEMNEQAQDILSRFENTYVEVSPSGTEIHLFCLVNADFTFDTDRYYIKHGGLEVYVERATNRFMTVTGERMQGVDLTEETEAARWLPETYMRRPDPADTVTAALPARSFLTDEEALQKVFHSKTAKEFKKLWDGDISSYASASEADMALAGHLAFWCAGDQAQMDRLFRRSSLMRHKWDERRGSSTYGNSTLRLAVQNSKNFYRHIFTGGGL